MFDCLCQRNPLFISSVDCRFIFKEEITESFFECFDFSKISIESTYLNDLGITSYSLEKYATTDKKRIHKVIMVLLEIEDTEKLISFLGKVIDIIKDEKELITKMFDKLNLHKNQTLVKSCLDQIVPKLKHHISGWADVFQANFLMIDVRSKEIYREHVELATCFLNDLINNSKEKDYDFRSDLAACQFLLDKYEDPPKLLIDDIKFSSFNAN